MYLEFDKLFFWRVAFRSGVISLNPFGLSFASAILIFFADDVTWSSPWSFSLSTASTDWLRPLDCRLHQSNRAVEVGDEYVIKWVTDNNAT